MITFILRGVRYITGTHAGQSFLLLWYSGDQTSGATGHTVSAVCAPLKVAFRSLHGGFQRVCVGQQRQISFGCHGNDGIFLENIRRQLPRSAFRMLWWWPGRRRDAWSCTCRICRLLRAAVVTGTQYGGILVPH